MDTKHPTQKEGRLSRPSQPQRWHLGRVWVYGEGKWKMSNSPTVELGEIPYLANFARRRLDGWIPRRG